MQITCEKCQTSYQVDDKLIPAAGAPVQCTKCGNLFTAYPTPAARVPAKTVMMFAAEAPAEFPPIARPAAVPARTASAATAPVSGRAQTAFHGLPASETTPVGQGSSAGSPARVDAAFPPATDPFAGPVANPFPTSATRPASRSGAGAAPSTPAAFASGLGIDDRTVLAELPKGSTDGPIADGDGLSQPAPLPAGLPADIADAPLVSTRPGRLTQMFFNQGTAVEQANVQAAKSAQGELDAQPDQTPILAQAEELEQQLGRKNRLPLYLGLGALAAAILAGLSFTYLPLLLGPFGADGQAVTDRLAAVTTLQRDDGPSLLAADAALARILARKPQYAEAKADRALADQFLADDRTWQAERLGAQYDRLNRQVQGIGQKTDPANMAERTKAVEAMTNIKRQYDALGAEAAGFQKRAQTLAAEAAKDDPQSAVVERARAFVAADADQSEKATRLVANYLKLTGKPSGKAGNGWSELALAELTAAGRPSEQKRQDGLAHLQAALAADPALIRARYLKVRLDTLNKREAEAKEAVAALAAANPAHGGGPALLAGLEEQLAQERADKEARERNAAGLGTPSPAVGNNPAAGPPPSNPAGGGSAKRLPARPAAAPAAAPGAAPGATAAPRRSR